MEHESLRRRRTISSDTSSSQGIRRREERGKVTATRVATAAVLLCVVTLSYVYLFPKHGINSRIVDHVETQLHAMDLVEKRHAVIIDAGSTGSRVLAFSFHVSPLTGELVLDDELWHQVKPGLSSFADEPEKGGQTIQQLIQKAKGRIPEQYWANTPIALKATAGLRLLPEQKANQLINTAQAVLSGSGFLSLEGLPLVEIMSDLEEGIFGWVTINFLLNKLSNPEDSAVALDLGGGSTQISFLPTWGSTLQESPDGFLHVRDIAGEQTNVYTHSYLGLGLMAARKAIIQETQAKDGKIENPCFKQTETWSFHGEQFEIFPSGNTGFKACNVVVNTVLTKMDLHSPAELETRDIVAFSYFYDRAIDAELLPEGGGQLTLQQYKQAGEKWCDHPAPSFQCIDLTFIYSLLNKYGLKDSTEIGIFKQINGHETSWALGAALDLLDKQN